MHHHAKNRGSSLYSTVSNGFGSAAKSGLNLVTRYVGPLTNTAELAPERTQQARARRRPPARSGFRSQVAICLRHACLLGWDVESPCHPIIGNDSPALRLTPHASF